MKENTHYLTALVEAPLPAPTASVDEQLISLWLHGRSKHTKRAYQFEVERFLAYIADRHGRPTALADVTLEDLQSYSDGLTGQGIAVRTTARAIAAVKSLFAFGAKLGALRFDTARPLKQPKVPDELAERILSAEDVQKLIGAAQTPRERAVLLTLYYTGMRASELCELRYRNLSLRNDARFPLQATVFGKGGKTRVLLLRADVVEALVAQRPEKWGPNDYVFRGSLINHLTPMQLWRLVRRVAQRAELELEISPHWLRHAHASHALDNGAPIHLVQATLGHSSLATTSRYTHARPTESSGGYLK